MPDLTPKLKLKLPLGNEAVNRASYNENLTLMDQNAASQAQADEPFFLKYAIYDSATDRIMIAFGPGRAAFLDVLVAKNEDSLYFIEQPAGGQVYYLYLKSDGNYLHNTTGGVVAGAVMIWKITTGSPMGQITLEDRRGRLPGASAQMVADQMKINDPLGVPKPFFGGVLPVRHLWCDGLTIGDTLSRASSRANTDIYDLYCTLWTAPGLKIFDVNGVLTSRGTTSQADWNAHRQLELPRLNGRALIGRDNLGGNSANVVTDGNADVLGGTGGEEKHTLTVQELASHNHKLRSITESGAYGTHKATAFHNLASNYYTYGDNAPAYPLVAKEGEDQSHNNMQPWIACNWIMRY